MTWWGPAGHCRLGAEGWRLGESGKALDPLGAGREAGRQGGRAKLAGAGRVGAECVSEVSFRFLPQGEWAATRLSVKKIMGDRSAQQ